MSGRYVKVPVTVTVELAMRVMEVYGRRGGVASHIRELVTRWSGIVSFKLRAALPIDQVLCRPHSRCDLCL